METPAENALQKVKSQENKEERGRILQELVESEYPWACDVLLECLDDSNEENRDLIIKALGQYPDMDMNRLCQKLTALPWFVKSSSLRILGMRKDPQMVNRIAPILEDPNADVRIWAAWALGEIGGDEARSLLARLAKDSNNFVRSSAEKALQKASELRFI
jgi:HEAT repeat protein